MNNYRVVGHSGLRKEGVKARQDIMENGLWDKGKKKDKNKAQMNDCLRTKEGQPEKKSG